MWLEDEQGGSSLSSLLREPRSPPYERRKLSLGAGRLSFHKLPSVLLFLGPYLSVRRVSVRGSTVPSVCFVVSGSLLKILVRGSSSGGQASRIDLAGLPGSLSSVSLWSHFTVRDFRFAVD